MEEIKIPYYEDKTRISNSNIGWFLTKGPKYLKDMLDGKEKGLEGSFLEKGTMIHMYILQPDEFWDNYVILDFETPKSEQQKLFAKAYIESLQIEENKKIIDAYKLSYAADKKSDDECLLRGIELKDKLDKYITYLQIETENKKTISWADYRMLENIKSNIKSHKLANVLIYEQPATVEQHNEFHVNWEYPEEFHDMKLLCKSLLDRVIFDHENKKITLIDLKTTSDLATFGESIKKYDYLRQLSFYWLAIMWFCKQSNINLDEYTQETYIVAAQTNGSNPVKVIKFNDENLIPKVHDISYAISEICWHIKNNLWDFNRAYYDGDGFELYSEH